MQVDNKPWKETKPIKGFEHFIDVFRKEQKKNEESKK